MKYALYCRLDSCGVTETFDSIEGVNHSNWTEVGRVGQPAEQRDEIVYEHRAYCEHHSIE